MSIAFLLGMISSRDFPHGYILEPKMPKKRRLGGKELFVM
jgi:hypothetical protein